MNSQDMQIDLENNKNVLFRPNKNFTPMEEEVSTTNFQEPIKVNPMMNATQSILNRSSMMTYSKIVCCLCSAIIDANSKGMCNTCAKNETNITEGITKQGLLTYCKLCDRYQRPPWVRIQMESPDMMSMLLSKTKGLNRVKLTDSSFVWTEPHSKIIKIKLTVQKEVNKSLIETSFLVEFKVEWTQCDDCKKTFTPHIWNAAVQIRQKVSHKRTFMLLEQIILKHKAHSKALNVKEMPEGIDFFFKNKSQANALSDFIHTQFPAKVKQSKQLVSHDQHSNLYNYKYTFMIELSPVCKDDLIILPPELSKELGGIGPVLLCHKVSSKIHLLDPLCLETYDFDANTYWKYNFRSYVDRSCLQEFLIVNVEEEVDYKNKYANHSQSNNMMEIDNQDSKTIFSKSTNYKFGANNSMMNRGMRRSEFKPMTVQCIYNNSSGMQGTTNLITVKCHFGDKIRPGEVYYGKLFNLKY
jgi:NMD protein affecting ribosome stability and mRNA decay